MHVTEINIYPIKSTRCFALTKSRVLPRGLQWDRRWMLVDGDGKFITARQYPILTLVTSRIDDGKLLVSAPDMPNIEIPLKPSDRAKQSVRIWRDQCTALHLGEHYYR